MKRLRIIIKTIVPVFLLFLLVSNQTAAQSITNCVEVFAANETDTRSTFNNGVATEQDYACVTLYKDAIITKIVSNCIEVFSANEVDTRSTYNNAVATEQDYACVNIILPSCALVASLIQSVCNNNGTPTTIPKSVIDDYFDITINANNGSATGNYEVVLTGSVLANKVYGTNTVLSGSGGRFKADGSSVYTLTIRDQADNTCAITKTTTVVAHCSTACPPQLCPIVTGVKN
jgi:hypothetical protein